MPNAALGAHRQVAGKSAGNGTIMRCAPIALRYVYDERRLIDGSRDEALITHFDPLAWTGSIAVNLLIVRLLTGAIPAARSRMWPYACRRMPKAAAEVADVLRKARGDIMVDCCRQPAIVLDTLRVALWALLGNTTFEETVVAAINQGGDADTQGAVTGAFAGALYGVEAIPARWLERLQGRDELWRSPTNYLAAEYRRVVV